MTRLPPLVAHLGPERYTSPGPGAALLSHVRIDEWETDEAVDRVRIDEQMIDDTWVT